MSRATCLGVALAAVVFRAAPGIAQEPDGPGLYRQNCRNCHGALGVPPARSVAQYKDIPGNLMDPAFLQARSDDSLVIVMSKGVGKDMKPLAEKLKKEEMLAIAKYLRSRAK